MQKKIGVIGIGNLGGAIIKGLINSGFEAKRIIAFNPTINQMMQQCQFLCANNASEVAQQADIIILAVKPPIITQVLTEIMGHLTDDSIIVSVAAGITLENMEMTIGKHRKIIRMMPNTPVLVNEAMISITANHNITANELDEIQTIFKPLGKTAIIDESLIHAVVGVSGSSPAYVFMFIEALADGAVLIGMPRQKAYQFAAQAVLGAAKLVLETGRHPAELKDSVCSPGGTTIEAVNTLERTNFRAAIIEAVKSSANKSKIMSQSEQ